MNDVRVTAACLIATSTVAQLGAGWTAVLPIAALAIYGWLQGIFLALVAGLQVLASFVLAMACAQPLAAGLETFGVSQGTALPVAYLAAFAASVTAIRIGVGAGVPEGVVRFAPAIDQVGGACVGALAGALLGGALLVGWTLAPTTSWLRFDADQLPFDGGRRMLWTFARCSAPDVGTARALCSGEPPAQPPDTSGLIVASEPFVDSNDNGVYDAVSDASAGPSPDIPERYLDLDGDHAFTAAMRFVDGNGDGRRAIGLTECYRLAEWRRVRCMHAPRITSADAGEIQENHVIEEPIYTAAATDADRGDTISFSVRAADGQAEPDVAIDAATGVVTLRVPADFEVKKRHNFVIEARDRAGLTDERRVSIRVRDVALE